MRWGRAAAAAAAAIAGALVALTATGPAASAATTAEQLAGARYVALGDSFVSGYGLPPYAASPAPGCLQSSDSIAHRVASTYGLSLTDVSCTGATIANVTSTPQTVPGATVRAQLDAVTADTALVTVSIGGNDAGFSTVLASCAALGPSGPLLQDPASPSCAVKLGSQLAAAVDGLAPGLDAMLAAIHRKAPNAKVIVLGYPALAPTDAATPAGGCFSSALGTGQPPLPRNAFPFTDADRTLIASLSARLDAAQRASADRNGATFVSVLADSDAHTPCAGSTDPYLNGISLTSLQPPALAEGAMHPNAAGAAFLAARLQQAVGEAFPATGVQPGGAGTSDAPAPSPTVQPAAVDGPTTRLAESGSEIPTLLITGAALAGIGAVLLLTRRTRPLGRRSAAPAPK
ncbi:SGNH/GDSL hydrolase family protein [Leifsonia sp. 22587]|uniref:SGNH/GDSL hydrolase family protein n=1 Tax=Leifsonia sp. 22587 TaxID=3453946 RepID=UPI003F8512E6